MKNIFNPLIQMILTGTIEFKMGFVLYLLLNSAAIIMYIYTEHKKTSVGLYLFSIYFFYFVMEYEKTGGWD